MPLRTLVLLALLLSQGCVTLPGTAPASPAQTAAPTAPPRVSVAEIRANPQFYADREVTILGYGLMVATYPLCPGYVGLDTRTQFVDAVGDHMAAVDRLPKGVRRYDSSQLRAFAATVRIFSGEMGCPGAVKLQTVPYLEVTGLR